MLSATSKYTIQSVDTNKIPLQNTANRITHPKLAIFLPSIRNISGIFGAILAMKYVFDSEFFFTKNSTKYHVCLVQLLVLDRKFVLQLILQTKM